MVEYTSSLGDGFTYCGWKLRVCALCDRAGHLP